MNRTECNCDQCQVGCRTMPGYLDVSDLENIPIEHLARSAGATVMDHESGETFSIPTIVPKQQANGHCVFYRDGLCDVHEHAPFGCRMYSACDDSDSTQIGLPVLQEIARDRAYDGPYAQAITMLPLARPLEQRRAAYRDAFINC